MLLAELAPVLRRHVRVAADTTPFGYWPLDLPHILQAYGTWYLQRQLFGYLPDHLPDPDLHTTLHTFWEERLNTEDYWHSLIHTPWPAAFYETDDPTSCGTRGEHRTAAAYGVASDLDPRVGPTINPMHTQHSIDTNGEAAGYSPQSPQEASNSEIYDWAYAGYSPTYTPSSPTYTPPENQDGDTDRIDRGLHALRTQGTTSNPTPEVIEITPNEDEEFDSDYNDE